MKRKNLNEMRVLVAMTAQTFPKWEEYPHTPGSFRKSGKQRTYRIRNLEEDTEDGRQGDRMGMLDRHPAVFVRADSKGVTSVTVSQMQIPKELP